MIPIKFKARMKEMLANEYDDFIASYDRANYHSLRINPLKHSTNTSDIDFKDSCNPLSKEVQHLENALGCSLTPVRWCNTGFYYDENIRPGKHPLHEAGAYYIQEASAMAPAEYLDINPGETVLDLCAAPGGKSTQIAGKMNGEGLLISNEIIPSRAKILSENIERMGIRNAVVTNESSERLAHFFPEFFDKIMVDAPCSGEGMFRKNTTACDEWSTDNVINCAKRQAEILDNAATMLKTGGRIVYSTCTFSPEENEGTIIHFLLRNPDFFLVDVEKYDGMSDGSVSFAKMCLSDTDVTKANGFLQTIPYTIRMLPHRLKGEGHFVAVLEKKPFHETTESDAPKKLKRIKGVKDKSIKEYLNFADSFFINKPAGTHIMFGDNLYVVPEICPPLDGIKVLRAGLLLGTFLKNRFEPAHSIALALSPSDVRNVINISLPVSENHNITENSGVTENVNTTQNSDADIIYKYINGETFSYDGEKGWYLIAVNGYSIGFGKLSSGIMKNHYPKGLRKSLK